MPEPTIPKTNQNEPRTPSKVVFDWESWLPYLEDSEASDADKRLLIETLWRIVLTFVDLGWEVHSPGDQRAESCGQEIDLTAELRKAVIQSKKLTEKEAV